MENNYLDVAIKAAIEAGNEIINIYENKDYEVELKSDASPLTIADKKSNETIVKYLTQTGVPILSEEGKSIKYEDRADWDILWIVDPLDGTKEFINRNGEFTVNIALIENGVPALGVVYVPVSGELYYADKKDGSFKYKVSRNNELNLNEVKNNSIKLPINNNRETFVVVASRSHMSTETEGFIKKLSEKHGSLEIRSKGSSLKICMVAEGDADVYPRFAPTMEWDTAAGHAIAKYAGKEIYIKDTLEPLSYNKENLLNPFFIVK